MTPDRPVFDVSAAESLGQLPKRKEQKALQLVRAFAAHPFVRSDCSLADESGRAIEYLLIEEFVFGYWLDHPSRELRIVEIHPAF